MLRGNSVIGIYEYDEFSLRMVESRISGGAYAPVGGVEYPYAGIAFLESIADFAASVPTSVVDEQKLKI